MKSEDKLIALTPRDGLYFKDGRSWAVGASGRASTLDWPFPSTLRGALRAVVGHAQEKELGRKFTKEDWLERTADVQVRVMLPLRRSMHAGTSWLAEHLLWPAPGDALALADSKQFLRLNPTSPRADVHTLSEVEGEEGLRLETLWRPRVEDKSKPVSGSRWWTHRNWIDWLCGQEVERQAGQSVEMPQQTRMHVGISAETGAARDAMLFSSSLLEGIERDSTGRFFEWAIGLKAHVPAALPHAMAVGGKRHLADVSAIPGDVFAMPLKLEKAFSKGAKGLRLIAVTPLHFERGWLLDGFSWDEAQQAWIGTLAPLEVPMVLRAAIMARPQHVSGWDMAHNRAKPTIRLVAPGSVFYFERADGKSFTLADAQVLWLHQVGQSREDGFGTVVPGVWEL